MKSRIGAFGRMMAIVLLAATLLPAAAVRAATDEYSLKAAFLFNFTRFVEWPTEAFARAGAPFQICVYGDDPFDDRLDALARRRVGERSITITRPTSAAALPRCQIAYFGDGTPADVEAAAVGDAAPTTLTVASDARFAREGGMVALVTSSGRVRLHVNLDSIRRSPLRVSAKLLEVSEVRHGGGGGR
ncbi:YfiR family protein [Silanimonas algicola]